MSNVIAIVKTMMGKAEAISVDGVRRQLIEGDHIFKGDQLVTGPADSVSLALTSAGQTLVATAGASDATSADSTSVEKAGVLTLGPSSNWSTAESLTAPQAAQASESATAEQDTRTVEANNEGNTHVILGSPDSSWNYILTETGNRIDPNVGYPTGPIGFGNYQRGNEFASSFPDDQVPAKNNAVIAADDRYTMDEDGSAGLTLLTNDIAPDGGLKIFSINGVTLTGGAQSIAVPNGTVVIATDGSISFTPEANFHGDVSFDYVAKDADGDTDTATVLITVNPVVDLVAADDYATTDEDVPIINGSVTSNDSTTSGGSLTYAVNTGVSNGTLIFNSDGSYTYTPDHDYNGEDSFTYTVNDAAASESLTRTVHLTINPVNDPPVIGGGGPNPAPPIPLIETDSPLSDSGSLIISDVDTGDTPSASHTATDITAIGITLTPQQIIEITNGFSIDQDGHWTFNLASPDYLAEGDEVSASFTVTVTDDSGATASIDILVTIVGTNDAPVITSSIADAQGTVIEAGHEDNGSALPGDPTASGTLTATDIDTGDVLTWSLIGAQPTTYGNLVLNPTTGAWTYTLDNTLTTTQALKEGQSVTQIYTARVTDDFGAFVEQTITVTIDGTNDVPVITNDVTALEGSVTEAGNLVAGTPSSSGNLSATDVDADATQSWSLQGSPDTTYGSMAIDPTTGIWTYTLDNSLPATQALNQGDTVTLTYTARVTDDFGAYVDQTITVTINGSNDLVSVTVPDNNGSAPGDLSVREDLTTTGSFSITAPDGLDPAAALTIAGTPVSKTDLEGSGTTPVAITTPQGVLTITGYDATTGIVSYSYDPSGLAKDHTGGDVLDSISIVVKDDSGTTASSPLIINILDTAPLANPDSNAVTEDSTPNPVAGNVISGTGADTLGADATAVTGIIAGTGTPTSNVSSGTTSANGTSITGSFGTLVQGADGSYSYTLDNSNPAVQALNDGETSTDVFTYTITDADGDVSTTTLTVTITGSNDSIGVTGPGAQGSLSVREDLSTTSTFTIIAPDGLHPTEALQIAGIWISKAELEASDTTNVAITTPEGVLTVTGYNTITGLGSYSYDPSGLAKDHSGGLVTDNISIVVKDDSGDTASNTLKINILDTAPVANPDSNAVTEDSASNPVAGNVISTGAGADTLGTDATAVTGIIAGSGTPTSNVPAGTTSADGTSIAGSFGTLVQGADGSYSYTLDNSNPAVQALAQGQKIDDVFTYTITDADGDTSSTTLTVTLTGVNDAPIITVRAGDSASAGLTETNAGLSTAGTLSIFDVDTLDTVAASKVDALTVGGTYSGPAFDVAALKAMLSVSGGESSTSAQDAPNGINWGFNSGSQTFDAIPAGATLILTYTVRATDSHGASVDQPVTITITGTNDVPVISNLPAATAGAVTEAGHLDDGTVVTGTPGVTGTLSASDADAGATQTWAVQGTPSTTYGTFAFDPGTRVWTYTLDNSLPATQALKEGQSVTQDYVVRVTDDKGAYVEQTITVTINGTNDVPVITNDMAATQGSVTEAGHLDDGTAVAGTPSATGTLIASDVDAGATQTWSLTGTPSTTYGNLVLNSATGIWTYTLDNSKAATQALKEGQSVTQTYTARVTDDFGAYVDQTITVTLNGTNDVPVITNLPAALAGSVTEAGHLDNGTVVAGTPSASGTLTATDVDSGATKAWSLQGTTDTTYGSMALNSATGVWTYTLNNTLAATQALKENQSVDLTYTARVTDDFGAYVDQTITVTINGTNDVPVVTNLAAARAGTVIEAGNLDDGTAVAGTPSASGTLTASDVDAGATQTWSLTGTPSTTYGSLVLNSATGIWTYTLDNSKAATQALKENQTVTQTYTARVTDDFGAYVDQTITVTINGTNDVPVISNSAAALVGTVTEAGHLDDGTAVAGTPSASGTLTASDVDTGATKAWTLQGVQDTTYGSMALNVATGVWTYTLDNTKAATQALKEGDSVDLTYTARVTDDFGAYADQTITVTVKGTNDVPVITNLPAAAAGAVTEAGHLDDGTVVPGTVTTTGTLSASDVDAGATQTWTVQGTPSTTYGTFAFDPGTRVWTYTLDNSLAATQALKEGQSVNQTYVVRVTDDFGAYVDQTITVTINGTNDVPVISNSAAALAGTVTEAGNLDDGTVVPGTPSTTGSLTATDVDSGATQNWTLQGTPSTTYGNMVLNAATGVWTYTLNNSLAATQALKEGESVTQSYTARVTDDFGAYVDQTIIVTITGTNDVPVAVADVINVTEDAADQSGSNDSNAATTIVAGNVLTNDTDVDAGDKALLAVSSVNGASGNVASSVAGTYGSVLINANGSYTYTLDNTKGNVQALASGQSVTDAFTYTITDSQGATSSTTLKVTVNGTNDAPIIDVRTGDSASASLTETNSGLSVSDTLSIFDVDTLDTVVASNLNSLTVGGTYSGPAFDVTALKAMFSVSGGEPSSSAQDNPSGINWSFNSGSQAFDPIPVGQTLILTYTVRATDSKGAFVDQPVTITITGTNDGVVAVNDSLSIAENAIAASTPFGGNVLTNDTLDPDAGVTTNVSSFSLDADGNGSQDVFTPGTPVTVTTSSGTLGVLTMASNGAYTFTPHQANYSGPVPVITYTLLSSTGDSDTATLTLTVTPVSDQPGVTRDAATVTTNEDTAVALGFNAPTVTDAVDQNGSGNPGDNPERLSLITLNGVPSGAQLLDGTNGDTPLFTSTGGNITIRLSDATNLISSPGAATLTMTTAQFEALKFLPVADSAANIARVRMSVTEYEVTDTGSPISGVAGAVRNADVAIDVRAVTDTVDLKINGSDVSHDATIAEDSALDLKALLTASFQDLDGSEHRDITITNPVGNGTIFVNGSAVAAGATYTIAWNAAGNNLETSQSGFPAISITPGANFSGDLNGITVTLSAKDTDSDSPSATPATLTDSVTLNLHVTPVAGDVTAANVSTAEDTSVKFLQNLALTDTDGSETLTAITVNALQTGWVIRDELGATVFTGNGSAGYTVPAGEVSNGDFRNYTLTPPGNSSADITLSLSVTTTDSQTVNGIPLTDSKTVILTPTVSVSAVAEVVGGDSNNDTIADLTITPGVTYASQGAEDQWFTLNKDGFDLKANWNNQDADGSEQTFALLTPVLGTESPIGSQFRYTDGTGTHTLTYTGTAVQIPLSALDTVEFLAPANVSGAFEIQVQALTIDTDPNGGAPVQAISGSATLTNLIIAPVADAVTLAVDAPAVGKEDTAIPLNIRPTSADPSETFNITISQIPTGSVITYGGVVQTISAGSVTITDFSAAVALSVTPPLNSNVDFTLSVSGVSVDTSAGITSTSAPVSLNMLVDVRGVADTVTVNTQVLQTSEATVEANSQKIALSGAITSVVPFDNDGSETVSLVITGIPANVNVEGLTYIGGIGSNRVWSGTPAQINAANLVIQDAHFSGTIEFQIRAVSTENDGNSLTGQTLPVSIQVAPSTEATLAGQTTLAEDTLTQLDFSIQKPDSNETLESVWIKAADVDSQPFQLFLGTTLLSTALVADAGWYKLTPAQAGNLFAQGAANSDADYSFAIKYEIRDPSSDGTLPATVTQSDASYTLDVTPVTDPTTSANDFVDRIITATETVTINVTVTQDDDPNAGGAKDIDGSEKLLYFTIDGVPAGVTVVGGKYIGNDDQPERNTGRWQVDTTDAPFSSASLAQSFEFALDGSSLQLSNLDEVITITAYTQDSGGLILKSSTDWHLQTGSSFDDSLKPPTDPAIIDSWIPDTTLPPVLEDAPLTLSDYVDAQISGSSTFAVTITGLSAGTQVSGMTRENINGTDIWTVQGVGDNAALQAVLNGITITPPANSNLNNTPGGFSFTTTLTTYDVGGGRNDASLTFSPIAEPITDAIDLSISAPGIDEDTLATITLTLGNPEDGAFSQVIDGKVYISLNEGGLSATGGTLSFGGSPLTSEAVSGVNGVPDGSYYVLTGVTSTANLTLEYQPAANASGTLGYSAYVLGQEDNTLIDDITTSMASGSLTISPVNEGGSGGGGGGDPVFGVTIDIADQTGNEDMFIQLPVSATLTDPSEQLASLTLSNVPDGVLVYAGTGSPGSLAINLGDMAGNPGYSVWGIPLLGGAIPGYIALQTPANWSGVITGLEFGVWSGEAGLDPSLTTNSFDVTVNGVADGINMTPTLSFGAAGDVVALNLNSTMPDSDGSELATLSIKNLGEHASFYAGSSLLTASYDLASDTYTLDGLTPLQVSALGVIQKSGSYNLQVSAFTTDYGGDNTSATPETGSLTLNLTSAGTGSTLLGDGSGNVLLGTSQNDSLTGGAGSDTLTGGKGADIFIWRNGDKGTALIPDHDVVKDFKPSEGDRIDLKDLLQGENDGNILNFLHVDTATSTLQISSTGTVGFNGSNADVTIKLEDGAGGNALPDFSGMSQSQIITSLIAGADPLVKVDHS